MATTTSITTTYAGEFARKYISAALLSGETLRNENISISPNIKYKSVMKKVATDANLIKDATCDFTDTGTITLTERVLQPEEFQVNVELCKKDFRSRSEEHTSELHHTVISYAVFCLKKKKKKKKT